MFSHVVGAIKVSNNILDVAKQPKFKMADILGLKMPQFGLQFDQFRTQILTIAQFIHYI